jgi:hypothetical protein
MHSSIHLHDVVLNYLSTGTTLPFLRKVNMTSTQAYITVSADAPVNSHTLTLITVLFSVYLSAKFNSISIVFSFSKPCHSSGT